MEFFVVTLAGCYIKVADHHEKTTAHDIVTFLWSGKLDLNEFQMYAGSISSSQAKSRTITEARTICFIAFSLR